MCINWIVTKKKKISKLLASRDLLPPTKCIDPPWLKSLSLTTKDRECISNNKELDDFIIFTALQLIQKKFPMIFIQPPATVNTTGFDYCPYETIQIIHTGSHHWILLSSFSGRIKIYDSLNSIPTQETIKQMTQLFSPDDSIPTYKQVTCHKQCGVKDCGLFTLAYGIDLLLGNDPSTIIYDQSKMRPHLINCFEKEEITSFPKYKQNISPSIQPINNSTDKNSEWKQPRRSVRIKKATQQQHVTNQIISPNKFEVLFPEDTNEIPSSSKPDIAFKVSASSRRKNKLPSPNSIIYNISDATLTTTEKSLGKSS